MATKYLFSAELFDIIHNEDGWYFVVNGMDKTEGPFASVGAMAEKMAKELEASIKYAWCQKFDEIPK